MLISNSGKLGLTCKTIKKEKLPLSIISSSGWVF
jgi:hypothetical protein